VVMNKSSVGLKTQSLCTVRGNVWLSEIWQSTASAVERFTKASPTIGEMPLDSLMAQMICWSLRPPMVEAAVLTLVLGLPVPVRLVSGLLAVLVRLSYVGYEVDAKLYEVDPRVLAAMVAFSATDEPYDTLQLTPPNGLKKIRVGFLAFPV